MKKNEVRPIIEYGHECMNILCWFCDIESRLEYQMCVEAWARSAFWANVCIRFQAVLKKHLTPQTSEKLSKLEILMKEENLFDRAWWFLIASASLLLKGDTHNFECYQNSLEFIPRSLDHYHDIFYWKERQKKSKAEQRRKTMSTQSYFAPD